MNCLIAGASAKDDDNYSKSTRKSSTNTGGASNAGRGNGRGSGRGSGQGSGRGNGRGNNTRDAGYVKQGQSHSATSRELPKLTDHQQLVMSLMQAVATTPGVRHNSPRVSQLLKLSICISC